MDEENEEERSGSSSKAAASALTADVERVTASTSTARVVPPVLKRKSSVNGNQSVKRPRVDLNEEYMTKWLANEDDREKSRKLKNKVLTEQLEVLRLQKQLLMNMLGSSPAEPASGAQAPRMMNAFSPIVSGLAFLNTLNPIHHNI